MTSDTKFYTCSDDFEYTHCTDPDEAIESFLDDCPRESWPTTLQVFCWQQQTIDPDATAMGVLDTLLEHLDDEYRLDGHNEATEAMKQAARVFIGVVLQNYEADRLELCGEPETIQVQDWVQQNRPRWLTEA